MTLQRRYLFSLHLGNLLKRVVVYQSLRYVPSSSNFLGAVVLPELGPKASSPAIARHYHLAVKMLPLSLLSVCAQRQCSTPAASTEYQLITSLSCFVNRHLHNLKQPNTANNISTRFYSTRSRSRIVPFASINENSSAPPPPPPRPPPPPAPRRALGVDYGRKFIGLAVSTLGLAPRPLVNMRGGGLDILMELAQGIIDAAVTEGKRKTLGKTHLIV
jgi:hypothetical protein